ncbi:MAG: dihydroxy-acid dehydratase, partial [Devosiaceae bacterium]|nr:dihydroxy-acid dehydratase [Devosiaceae bacterium]
HSPGPCTFYGTANTNQMLMEIMGLHLPGASFVPPDSPLRNALTKKAVTQLLSLRATGENYTPVGQLLDEKVLVNGIVGLLATGGSTNLTIHLIAIAAAAGISITWDDMSELSQSVPLLARIYPNGVADVNHFHAAGGMGFLIRELLEDGYLHNDVKTVVGTGLEKYTKEAKLVDAALTYEPVPQVSPLPKVLTSTKTPFSANGGLKELKGNLGNSIIKISAVKPEHRRVKAPAKVFHSQGELMDAFKTGKLTSDMIAVVRFCGPKAIGMPELHKLTPLLGILQDRGLKVALVTDGRMSGASGKVPAAIHLTPEALNDGPIAKIRDGDMLLLDADKGTLTFVGDEEKFNARKAAICDLSAQHQGMGRELFSSFRQRVGLASDGASIFGTKTP